MRPLRTLTLVVAMLVLGGVAGLWLAARHAQAALEPQRAPTLIDERLPHVPGIRFLPLGDELTTDGARRVMAYATVHDPMASLLARYERGFVASGHEVERRMHPSGEHAALHAVKPGEALQTTLVLEARGRDGTLLVASVSPRTLTATARVLPSPAGCVPWSEAGATDAAQRTAVAALVCPGFVADTIRQYDGLLAGAERTELATEEGVLVVYREGTDFESHVAVTQLPGEPPRVGVTVVVQEQR